MAIASWKLPPLRPGRAAPPAILASRAELAGLAALHPHVAGVEVERRTLAGIACHVVGPATALATLLYFHGGGYRLGDPETWVGFAGRLAGDGSLRVVLPDYRLAPEHPFPAALHDAAAVYRALGAAGEPIVLAGDSAGGGLAAALCVLARDNADPGPAGLILLSPWLDLSATAATYRSHAARDRIFSHDSATEAADLYLQGESSNHPLVSPLYADPAAFPPVQLFCGGDEVLLGDALAFSARLASANRPVEAHFVPDMPHVWPMLAPALPQSEALCADLRRFARALI
jgi:epsilon-lactone hydrolase